GLVPLRGPPHDGGGLLAGLRGGPAARRRLGHGLPSLCPGSGVGRPGSAGPHHQVYRPAAPHGRRLARPALARPPRARPLGPAPRRPPSRPRDGAAPRRGGWGGGRPAVPPPPADVAGRRGYPPPPPRPRPSPLRSR